MYNGDLGDRYTLTTCTSSFIIGVESKIVPKSFLVAPIVCLPVSKYKVSYQFGAFMWWFMSVGRKWKG